VSEEEPRDWPYRQILDCGTADTPQYEMKENALHCAHVYFEYG
jgi:hypothetical protein